MAQASSPYLRQHKDNPVHWQPWGQAAFDAALREDKPVLLSVGYAACHWCHVMAHESFDNPAIARLINSRFIAIKLDREERPDLDSLYQHALALMGKAGGWPLTMFLTPTGVPFWGGTYFPPMQRHGMPGFADVLAGVAESYDHERDAVSFNADAIKKAIDDKTLATTGSAITPEIVTRAAAHMLLDVDQRHGGLGTAPKFPQLTKLRLLFDHGLRSGDQRYSDAVVQALVQMCRGGLYDHIGGGFHRYCVDAQWLVPHFEKMLGDQCDFIALLADVLSHHPHPLLEQALTDTIAFVLRDLRDVQTGLFTSSLDADSDGGEGVYYQWSYAELTAELGTHAPLFCAAYDIQQGGNWPDPHHGQGNIPNRLSSALGSSNDEDLLRSMRKKLLYKRSERTAPARDDKILTDLNARMIAALAIAGWRLQRPEWLDTATTAFDRLTAMVVGDNGLARHIAGDHASACLLDDSAQLALTALTLATTTPPARRGYYTTWAKKLTRHASAAFMGADGSLRNTAAQALDSFATIPPVYDTPAPSGAGAFLRTLVWLAHDSEGTDFAGTATTLADNMSSYARSEFTMMASALSALQFYQNPVIIHASTAWDDFLRRYIPDSIAVPADNAALTLCLGTRCLLPAYNRDDAQELLQTALRNCLHKAANG